MPARPRFLVALLCLVLAACAAGVAASPDEPKAAPPAATAAASPTGTAVPPTPTPEPTPTPIPEPRDYAIAGGGWFYAETGFAVRDEPGGPRFWTEFQRRGGAATLGLPASQAYDAPGDIRAQLFQNGWLAGAAGKPAAAPGSGGPPEPPAVARVREDQPEMAFVGRVDVLPREVRQGHTVVLRVWAPSAESVTATIEGRNLPLVRQGDAFVALFAFHRMANLGARPVRFTLVDGTGKRTVRADPADTIQVVDGHYETEHLVVNSATLGLLDPARVNAEEALLNGIYSRWRPERFWEGPFVGPVGPREITSEFGTRRSINGGPVNWAHEGTDFDVESGDLIHAAANGRVVFAGPLHVRGNTVVVDHGWGVMTGYFHMFGTQVQVGQEVHQGDVLGLAGSTGFVTGPHLHFEVRVQNVNVEPMEWLNQAPHERPDLAGL